VVLGGQGLFDPNDHVRVIKRSKGTDGILHDPKAPADAKELESWNQSERMAIGIISGSIIDIHLELLHKYEDKSAWALWGAIEALHEQKDASLRHGAWMGLLGLRQGEDEGYCKYLRRLSEARSRVDRVTPASLSAEERMDELVLFAALSRMRPNDPLHQSLLTHRNLSLTDLSAIFLRTDQNSALSAAFESANVTSTSRCFTCRLVGHQAKDCPHADAISRLIAQRTNNNGGGGNNCRMQLAMSYRSSFRAQSWTVHQLKKAFVDVEYGC
jgi:hypothetical protein